MWNTPQNIWDVKYPSKYMRCELPLKTYEMWDTPQNIWDVKYPYWLNYMLFGYWHHWHRGSDLKYLFWRERRVGVLVEWCISCENVSYVGLSCVRREQGARESGGLKEFSQSWTLIQQIWKQDRKLKKIKSSKKIRLHQKSNPICWKKNQVAGECRSLKEFSESSPRCSPRAPAEPWRPAQSVHRRT